MDYHYNLPPPTKKLKKANKNKGGGGVKLSTDPQSVAARERRHRISDRFKILQSLVPNGHKMDTVSMLEEAIHYVKFLKTQIWLHETMFYLNSQTNDHHHHHQPLLSSTNTVSSQLVGPFFCATKPSSPLLGAVQPLYWPMEGVSPVNSENQAVETMSFDNIHDVPM